MDKALAQDWRFVLSGKTPWNEKIKLEHHTIDSPFSLFFYHLGYKLSLKNLFKSGKP